MSQVKTDSITEHTSGAGVSAPVLLHAAAGVNFGGSTLSHYDKGSNTHTITLGSGTATLDGTLRTLSYSRVGMMVTLYGRLNIASVSAPSGSINISLPIAAASTCNAVGAVVVNGASTSWTGQSQLMVLAGNPNVLFLFEWTAGSLSNPGAKLQANTDIYITITYEAAV